MKKQLFALNLLILAPLLMFAQDRTPVQFNNTQFNLNILAPSVTFEKRVKDNNSVTFGAGLTPLYSQDNNNQNNYVSINPFVRTSYRNYYQRKKVKKELNPNSGNYIGLAAGYYFGSIANNSDLIVFQQSNSFYMGALWGIQRNYKSGIHLGFSIGGGFGTGNNMDLKFVGVGELEFGFVISSKTD